jgi:hypothetical protein
MLNLRKTALAAMFVAAVAIPTAYAAGLFSTLPIVGGASFCASTVTGTGSLGGITNQGQGTTGSICAQTVPAGPPSLTGAEKFPADTQASGGANPQTVVVTTCQLGAGSYLNVSPVTTAPFSLTIPNQVCFYNVAANSTTTNQIITMPSAPLDGQIIRLLTSNTITNLGIAPAAGQTVQNPPTTATAPEIGEWIYNAAAATWYRIK